MQKLNKGATDKIEKHIGELTIRCYHLEELVKQLEIENQELRKGTKLKPAPVKQGQTIDG